jgi:flagellar motor switch protein FliG
MKSIFDMTGTEKAAALLMILGPEPASEILRHLDEKSIEKLSASLARMQSLPEDDKEELIAEFIIEIRRSPKNSIGGINKARQIVVDAFGEEKADELIKRIDSRDVESNFKFLNELKDSDLLDLLSNEQPQIIALVIKFLKPQKGGMVLKNLPQPKSKEVGVKLIKMKNPALEAAVAVARTLKKRWENKENVAEDDNIGGVKSLAKILGHMSSSKEKELLRIMEQTDPQISREIMEMTFTFDNIVNLSNREIRILIDEINNDFIIAKSLKGASDDIKFKILRNMSQNRAESVLIEMSEMGAVRLKDVIECRDYIVYIMQQLDENGVILIKRDGETYIE